MVQLCKTDENVGGNVAETTFIAAVLRLFHAKIVSDLLLRFVVVLTQIFQARIIIVHPCTNFHNHLVLTIVS